MQKYYPMNRTLNYENFGAHPMNRTWRQTNLGAHSELHAPEQKSQNKCTPWHQWHRQQHQASLPHGTALGQKKELWKKPNIKQGQKNTYQNPPSLPSTIKVMHTSNSHVTSSIPGQCSIMDMSMTKNYEENQVLIIKGCIEEHVFSIWKFYQKDVHSHFSKDDKTMCRFIMKHTNIRENQNWWLGMQRSVVKTHTDNSNQRVNDQKCVLSNGRKHL